MPRTLRESAATSTVAAAPEAVNVVEPILRFGARRADEPALVDGSGAVSYGALAARIRSMADALKSIGLGPGDRVGLCLKDTADHVVALLAAGWRGAVAVPLDWRATAAENSRRWRRSC